MVFECAICEHREKDLLRFLEHWQAGHNVKQMRAAHRRRVHG